MGKEGELEISNTIVVYKFVLGIGETLLGLSILFYGRAIVRIYEHYQVKELLEDPHDRLIAFTKTLLPFLLSNQTYFIIFLFLLGLSKIIGSIALWRGHDWGLDLIVGLFVILVPFNIVELVNHPTPVKLVYFLIDLLITFYLVEFKPHKYLKRLYRKFIAGPRH